MDFTPIQSNANSESQQAPARNLDLSPARSNVATSEKKPPRRSKLFAFTVRLTAEQRSHFDALAIAQGYGSVAAAFKAQALSNGIEHPLMEMRLSLEHMQERISEEGAWLQDQVQTVSHALDSLVQHVGELTGEIQTCTQAMVLFAQTNEALSSALSSVGTQRPLPPAASSFDSNK